MMRRELPGARRSATLAGARRDDVDQSKRGRRLALLCGRRWWWKTLLIVLLAMAVMAALGFWQLDRLEQRRTYEPTAAAPRWRLAPIELTRRGSAPCAKAELRDRLGDRARRSTTTRGRSRFAIRRYDGQPGVHLVTPSPARRVGQGRAGQSGLDSGGRSSRTWRLERSLEETGGRARSLWNLLRPTTPPAGRLRSPPSRRTSSAAGTGSTSRRSGRRCRMTP